MKIGLGLPESLPNVQGQFILEWAKRADAGAFSSVSVFDRLVYANYEPLVTLAAVAAVTQRVRLMTSVVLAPLRSPALLAKMASSIDALSNGRLSLGVGLGGRHDDFGAAGVPRERRASILEAQLPVMKRIWSGQPMSEAVGPIGPPVVSPRGPELLIGGYTQPAARRVGTWGDGFISGITSPATALSLYRIAEESWTEAGRPGKPRFVGAFLFALGPHARERAARFLQQYFAPEATDLVQSIPATAEAVRQAIEANLEVGMDEVILWPCIPDLDQVDRAAEIVTALLH
ncbi:MAG TPA: LLM class flavin-dependent oxidoreductase [Ktedonobacterales bacterium]|jgi:alkanesulfonate monooxygenase SsuD/methylene tetrahydromethanopterin reductase-like flavin-dependent oxidoreductase (luciferase family)|nr:LLM class flavin-dependent oxidoreductase [Ktedonobacterales bacterium]